MPCHADRRIFLAESRREGHGTSYRSFSFFILSTGGCPTLGGIRFSGGEGSALKKKERSEKRNNFTSFLMFTSRTLFTTGVKEREISPMFCRSETSPCVPRHSLCERTRRPSCCLSPFGTGQQPRPGRASQFVGSFLSKPSTETLWSKRSC